MKIKILVSVASIDFSFGVGDVVDVSDEIGNDLVRAKYAEEVKPATAKRKPKRAK